MTGPGQSRRPSEPCQLARSRQLVMPSRWTPSCRWSKWSPHLALPMPRAGTWQEGSHPLDREPCDSPRARGRSRCRSAYRGRHTVPPPWWGRPGGGDGRPADVARPGRLAAGVSARATKDLGIPPPPRASVSPRPRPLPTRERGVASAAAQVSSRPPPANAKSLMSIAWASRTPTRRMVWSGSPSIVITVWRPASTISTRSWKSASVIPKSASTM